jgi:hypothetical protein
MPTRRPLPLFEVILARSHTRVGLLVLLATLSIPVLAQAPDPARSAPVATVSGVVRDSIGRVPITRAIVQLAAVDPLVSFGRSATSDSLGRFTFTAVPNGQYTLGFFHPVLDSLGLEPPLRGVTVSEQRHVRIDLATPAPARLRDAICGRGSRGKWACAA